MGVDPIALYGEFSCESRRIDVTTWTVLVLLAQEINYPLCDLLDYI